MNRLLFFIACLFVSLRLPAQACGGGTLTLQFYVPNGEQVKDISYEVLPASEFNLFVFIPIASNDEKELYRHVHMNIGRGVVITEGEMMRFYPAIDTMNFKGRPYLLPLVKTSGKVKGATLLFPTRENNSIPYLLKISAGGRCVYFMHTLFGGCNRTINFLWNKESGFLRSF